jgi:hypothetical protein
MILPRYTSALSVPASPPALSLLPRELPSSRSATHLVVQLLLCGRGRRRDLLKRQRSFVDKDNELQDALIEDR